MNDAEIIGLFWARDEGALRAAREKYHPLLYRIARNITGSHRDAEECVSDAYLKLWNAIPPARPDSLRCFAARVARNAAIDAYRGAARRRAADAVFDEWAEVFADARDGYEDAELKRLIDGFLGTLDRETRALFVRRYWMAEPIAALCGCFRIKESAAKMRLARTRSKLREYLTKEGVTI